MRIVERKEWSLVGLNHNGFGCVRFSVCFLPACLPACLPAFPSLALPCRPVCLVLPSFLCFASLLPFFFLSSISLLPCLPTYLPTYLPSVRPSVRLSFPPAIHPSMLRPFHPWVLPSYDPSILPLFHPSIHPTFDPGLFHPLDPSMFRPVGPSTLGPSAPSAHSVLRTSHSLHNSIPLPRFLNPSPIPSGQCTSTV